MSETQPDTTQIATTLHDGAAAAKADSPDQKAAKDKLYDDILETWKSGQGTRDQASDMQRLSDGFHDNNMLAGFQIVGVDDQNQVIVKDLDTNEQGSVSVEQFEQISVAPPSSSQLPNGSELRAEVDPSTGNITKVVTPNGEIIPGNGIDVDVTTDGGIAVTDQSTGETTIYRKNGSWRTYNGAVGDPNALTSDNRYIQNQEGNWVLSTTQFDVPAGTVRQTVEGGGVLEGDNLVIAADGGYTFQRVGDHLPYTFAANGALITSVADWSDESKFGAQDLWQTNGQIAHVDYEGGNPAALTVNYEKVAIVGYDASSISVDQSTADVTVARPDGTTDLYKADGSIVTSGPLSTDAGAPQVVQRVRYPEGSMREFSGYNADTRLPSSQTDKDSAGNVTLTRGINGADQPTGYVDADGTYHYQEPGGARSSWRTASFGSYTLEGQVTEPESNPVAEVPVEEVPEPQGTSTVVVDGPITTTTELDENNKETYKKIENSELHITQEFTTEGGKTTVAVTNQDTGEVTTGALLGDASENGDYTVAPEGSPSKGFDRYGRTVQTRDADGSQNRYSYENQHTSKPSMHVEVTPAADPQDGASVRVSSIDAEGKETLIDSGATIPETGGGRATADNWFVQYQQPDGTKVTRDSYNRIGSQEAKDGVQTLYVYDPKIESTSPDGISREYPDGGTLVMERDGDQWSLKLDSNGSGQLVSQVEDVSFDQFNGDISYTRNGISVLENESGDVTYTKGDRVTTMERGIGGVIDSVTRSGGAGEVQFQLGVDGKWTRTQAVGDESQSDVVDDFSVSLDGSIKFKSNNGTTDTTLLPNGTSNESSTFANGDAVSVAYGLDDTATSWGAIDGESGITETVTQGSDGKPSLVVTDKTGEPIEIDPASVEFGEGFVSYVTPDGNRVEQRVDGTRVMGQPDDEHGFARYDSVQWHEVDGTESSRTYTYHKDTGELIHADGTGTASNEIWDRQEDGTYKRSSDGFVGVVSIDSDGTFKNAYRDPDGQVKVDEQRVDGAFRTRDSVPVEITMASGRIGYREEDGSVYGPITQDSCYSEMAWDVYQTMYPQPKDPAEKEAWLDRWHEFYNKGIQDNTGFYDHFDNNHDLVYPEDIFTFQLLGQTGPVAEQGEDEAEPAKVGWQKRTLKNLPKKETVVVPAGPK